MISSTSVFKKLSFSRTLKVARSVLLILCSALSLVSCRNELIDEIELMRKDASSPVIELNIDGETPLAQDSEIDCNQVSVGSTYELTLNIKNTGRSALIIDLSEISLTMSSNTEENTFTVVGQPSEQIDVDGNSKLTICFTPFSGGQKSATLSIPTNDFNNPVFTFSITGDGWAVVLTTNDISNIEMTTATGGGDIESDGGESIRERGICWGTNPNPTINDNSQSAESVGLGSYSTFMTGLNAGTLYYVRAYASNSTTTGYGSQVSFTTKPSSPTGLSAVPVGYPEGSGKLKVSWASENGPSTYYDVYYSTSNDSSGSVSGPTNLTQKSCTLTGLTDYQDYYIWVKAKNSTASSDYSVSETSMVGVKVTDIIWDKIPQALVNGTSETITANCIPTTATDPSITWTSNNVSVATVSNGVVSTIASTGSVTIVSKDSLGNPWNSFTATANAGTAEYQPSSVTSPGPAGGTIFYDKGFYSDGWRYLEAATENVGSYHRWWNGSYINIPVAYGTAFGTGKANTDAIIAAQGTGSYFASVCRNYSLNGYSDWFMPSKDEANYLLAQLQLHAAANFWGFASSSQVATNGCWSYLYSYLDWKQIQTSVGGTPNYYTRPIRQF